MPVTAATVNGRTAANYMQRASGVVGGAMAQHLIAYTNGPYILTLRDAVIAAGKPANDPMVTALNTAHYRCSDTIELAGVIYCNQLLEQSGDDVLAAAIWLEAQP